MRQSNNGRRTRGGRPTRRPGPLKSQTFDSNGPEVRIRGNAHQVLEKYQNLARDAHTNGDRVLAESYYQFAEHYYRIVHESTDPESPGSQRSHNRQQGEEHDEEARIDSDEGENEQRADSSRSDQPRTDQPRSDQQRSDHRSSRRRSDYAQQRQPAEVRDPVEVSAEAEPTPVNGETVGGRDREGLERTLGAKTLVLKSEEQPKDEGAEATAADGEATKPASSGNGQRSTRNRSRYRRSSTRSSGDEEASAPQKRQFPISAEASEPADGGPMPADGGESSG